MSSKAEDGTSAADPYTVERHFGDLAPTYSDVGATAANVRARGAADRMWKKVEEDLKTIDQADTDEAGDD